MLMICVRDEFAKKVSFYFSLFTFINFTEIWIGLIILQVSNEPDRIGL